MNTKKEIVTKLKEIKSFLEIEYAVSSIGIFGSFSNETHTSESDIDILVEFNSPIGWKFFTLELYLQKLLNRKVDLITKDALKRQLKDQILKDTLFI
jgi:predicted nucleotidyltransferase